MTGATPQGERSELLDALRGFALFGVLLVNLRSLSLYDLLPADERAGLPGAAIDAWLQPFMAALVDGTSITLFSLLFGVGFAIQRQRAASDPSGTRRYLRRLALLLAFGLVHAYLLWWGDILRYYAVLGLLLIPLARLPDRWLAALGVVICVGLPVWLQPVVPGLLPPQIGSPESAARALVAFRSDELGTLLSGNLERDLRMRIAVWFLPAYVLGRLMIGAALGRSGVLEQPEKHLRFWRRLFFSMLLVGGGLTVFFAVRKAGVFGEALPWLGSEPGKMLMRLGRFAAPLAMGLLYLAGLVLLYQRPAWRRLIGQLAPLGRLALTHYIGQTFIAIVLFYGIGLGFGGRIGLAGTVAVSALILALQLAASRWWLARFRFGPLEWLWRSLTYLQVQPMRRSKVLSESTRRAR
ncbi:DUF418 domain-containing protein [Arenimonas aestuarii]